MLLIVVRGDSFELFEHFVEGGFVSKTGILRDAQQAEVGVFRYGQLPFEFRNPVLIDQMIKIVFGELVDPERELFLVHIQLLSQ